MKNKRIILISLLLLIAIINVGAAVASEEVNIDDNIDTVQINDVSNNEEIGLSEDHIENLNEEIDSNELIDDNEDLNSLELEDANEEKDKLSSSIAEENPLSSTIEIDGSAANQMNNPTIQSAINSANDGDTIIITGKYYEHCHFIINKRLTIISTVGTVMSPCPSNYQGSGTYGIFYIGPQGSGTTIQGFTLINNIDVEFDSIAKEMIGLHKSSSDTMNKMLEIQKNIEEQNKSIYSLDEKMENVEELAVRMTN